ncbi:hypothetical protein ISS07_02970 [Candidatus Woesearchaeota archaeon]|nr:hypothetical protein [Candidatus Woesearchaeota archaeon]
METIDSLKDENGKIDKENIKKIIPYEDSFLYIDNVESLSKKNIVTTKKVRDDEYWKEGHFSGFPIMPGALIVEGLGQAATLLVRNNLKNHLNYDVLAYKIRSAKFLRPTFIGHELRFEGKVIFKFKFLWFVNGVVYRGEKLVAKVKMVLAVVEREKFRGHFKKK